MYYIHIYIHTYIRANRQIGKVAQGNKALYYLLTHAIKSWDI